MRNTEKRRGIPPSLGVELTPCSTGRVKLDWEGFHVSLYMGT